MRFASLIALVLSGLAPLGAQQWTPLFDGRSLNGWQTPGKARWSVEDGVLIGRQGPNGEPGDLLSNERYTNFELEAEWSMKWPANSGLWFKYQGPRTGCQADFLDQPDEPGVLSGSVYCIGPKFIAQNRDPKTIHKEGWNQLRLRVEGERVQVWMNGRSVAEGTVAVFPGPGQVGLQVHAGKQFEGMEIRMRSARIRRLP
ncbi:MAG TPA: hypothetical protein DEH78_24075 [Solibacterales bacterium]|nr:hypothetical protein [Bryobacterales bacterium]